MEVTYLIKYGPRAKNARDLGHKLGLSKCFVFIAYFSSRKKQIIQHKQVCCPVDKIFVNFSNYKVVREGMLQPEQYRSVYVSDYRYGQV